MSPEQSIAHYRITSKLGEGGMGAVYRATDTKLNRDVAVKVLPEAFARDAARMARFEREAQMLAALNHPNIAAIYGIEQGAIVMELVEGEDLKGPVPVETAIHYARQIAVALEAAHEKGIIHRDLKPANIKVTPDGTIKLLDFGLAKAGDEAVSAISGAPTMSPTLSLAMTQAGVILGTAAYMSPEQARGKPVDKRADIWAFGVVLFEMLAGKMLFGGGETVTDTIASVVTREPDWNALPATTPPHVRRLLKRCLCKDLKLRLQAIGEARILLDEAEGEPERPAPAAASRSWIPWSVAGALALALLAVSVLWLRPKAAEPGPGVSRFLIPLPPGTALPLSAAATQWVPSPDGRNLALVVTESVSGKEGLWVRPLEATSAHRLDKTEGANFPFWSPDGQFIAFFAEEKLKRVAVSGGSVQTVCDVPTQASGRTSGDGGAWSKDVIVFASNRSPLMRVPAMGGMPVPVTALENEELAHVWPQFLPDGRHLLYLALANDPANNAIYVQEVGSARRVRVIKNLTRAMWSPPGYVLFVREGTLFAQRMDPKTFQVEGEALAVGQEVLANNGNGRSTFAISQNGLLAYRSGALGTMKQLTWRDRDGKVLGVVGKPGQFNNPSLSPDEKSVAVLVGATTLDTWVMDLTNGVLTRMTRDSKGTIFSTPAWSPDSQRLAITQSRGGIQEITVASGTITPPGKDAFLPEDWLPDGRSILCNDRTGNRLSLLSRADGAEPQTILDTPFRKTSFRFTPDGKYVLYVSYESGPAEIYVASFPSFGVKKKVSTGGALYPVWARGGKEIFYRANDGALTSVEIRTGSGIEVGIPKPLFKFGTGTIGNRFAVTADGKRILINESSQREEKDTPEIILVLNWAAEIK